MSLIARLIEAGSPADIIEDVAMMIAEKRAAEKALESARAKARERQARKRERDEGRDVTYSHVTERDVTDRAFPAPPNENILTPPTHTPGNKPRARKGTRLAVDWSPEPLSADCQAIVSRWKPGEIERELSKFRDFWAAKAGADGSKLDWQATWRNWLRTADERQNGKANRTNPSTGQTRGDGFLAAIREVNNRPFDADRSGYAGGVRNPEGMGLLPASTA